MGGLIFPLADLVRHNLQFIQCSMGLLPANRTELQALVFSYLKTRLLPGPGLELRVQFPELFGVKGMDLALPFDQQAHRHGLYAARRQAAGNLGPQ